MMPKNIFVFYGFFGLNSAAKAAVVRRLSYERTGKRGVCDAGV